MPNQELLASTQAYPYEIKRGKPGDEAKELPYYSASEFSHDVTASPVWVQDSIGNPLQ